MKKQNTLKSERIWLDTQYDSSTVLPQWEGTTNPPPMYMDLVLCTLHSFSKDKLKQWANTNKHLSFTETLCGFFYYNPEIHGLCITESDKDKVYLVAKGEYGHAKAWTRSSPLSSRYAEETRDNNQKKWDSLVVEFDTYSTESVVFKQYGKNQVTSKMLTMQDNNFLLAKTCTILDENELQKHIEEHNNVVEKL